MEQFVILLVFGAVALLNWFLKRNQAGDEDAPTPRPTPRPESGRPRRTSTEAPARKTETEEERVRRFMEALGIPTGQMPPPVPQRPQPVESLRPVEKKVRPAPVVVPPPLPTVVVAEPVFGKSVMAAFPGSTEVVIPESASSASIASREAAAAFDLPTRRQHPARAIQDLLRSRDSVRNAILLREILGPPKGLQSENAVHSFP